MTPKQFMNWPRPFSVNKTMPAILKIVQNVALASAGAIAFIDVLTAADTSRNQRVMARRMKAAFFLFILACLAKAARWLM